MRLYIFFNTDLSYFPYILYLGKCAGGKNFTCNNKIIGARFYDYEDDSARDNLGHGTLTASTAAGNKVNGVSFYGLAEGTARGGVPSARIAVYKACDNQGNIYSRCSVRKDYIK